LKKYQRYQTVIFILSFLVVLEAIVIFALSRKKAPLPPPVAIRGKIAIVLDDWGYNLNNLPALGKIKYPLTMSVLPNLAYSGAVANEFNKRGYEVILHLPLEPREKSHLERNTIMISMNEETIKNIIDKDLAAVSHVKGVSNHMGSSATEDLRTMTVVFKELKRKQLYFLDSLVSSQSVTRGLARTMDLKFAKRDVFLDNQEEPEYIKGQLNKLKVKAAVYGQAIGIGHDRKITLEVLRDMMPQLEKEGYRFVFVSELVK
jgi:hypothetical protein